VQAAYHGIVAQAPQRACLINGGQRIEAVRADVLAVLEQRFGCHV
jgi:thymidylate kinase